MQVSTHIAETRRQIDEALRIRYQVFATEFAYVDPVCHVVPREVDPFDMLDTTIHFVALLDGSAVGTVRMLTPNTEVAHAMNAAFGFDIESKFDLGCLAREDVKLAETMRYCVIASARSRAVASALHAEAVRVSRKLGITHWIGCANTETNGREEAERIERTARDLGLFHPEVRIAWRQAACVPELVQSAEFHALKSGLVRITPPDASLPRILSMYSARMDARFIGPPSYDSRFRMYSIPLIMTVADQRIAHETTTTAVDKQLFAA